MTLYATSAPLEHKFLSMILSSLNTTQTLLFMDAIRYQGLIRAISSINMAKYQEFAPIAGSAIHSTFFKVENAINVESRCPTANSVVIVSHVLNVLQVLP